MVAFALELTCISKIVGALSQTLALAFEIFHVALLSLHLFRVLQLVVESIGEDEEVVIIMSSVECQLVLRSIQVDVQGIDSQVAAELVSLTEHILVQMATLDGLHNDALPHLAGREHLVFAGGLLLIGNTCIDVIFHFLSRCKVRFGFFLCSLECLGSFLCSSLVRSTLSHHASSKQAHGDG